MTKTEAKAILLEYAQFRLVNCTSIKHRKAILKQVDDLAALVEKGEATMDFARWRIKLS